MAKQCCRSKALDLMHGGGIFSKLTAVCEFEHKQSIAFCIQKLEKRVWGVRWGRGAVGDWDTWISKFLCCISGFL